MPMIEVVLVLRICKIDLGTVLSNMKVIVNESEAVDIEYSLGRTSISLRATRSTIVSLSFGFVVMLISADSFTLLETDVRS